MKKPIRILIADDHPILNVGLKMTLEQWEEFLVTGVASNGQEAVELARQTRPDIVIMDVQMPQLSGNEAARQIKAELPGVRVLAFTTFDDSETVRCVMEAGCDGFLLKVIAPERLRTSLLSIAEGISVYDEKAVDSLRQRMKDTAHIEFAERELRVLRCVCRGMTNGEIAGEMGLRPGTVKNMVSLLLSKTGCVSRSQLAGFAARSNLMSDVP